MVEPEAPADAPLRAAGLEALVRAVRADPRNSSAFHRLGLAFLRQAHAQAGGARGARLQLRQRALQCFSKAVNLDPDARGDAGEAGVRLLLVDPELSRAPGNPAEAGPRLQRQTAMQFCSQALNLSPRAFWAWRLLGFLQMDAGQLHAAIESLQNAVKGFVHDIFLWQALALCYQRLARVTAALKAYSKAMSLYGGPTSRGIPRGAGSARSTQAASDEGPTSSNGSAILHGSPGDPQHLRRREGEAAQFCRLQIGILSLVQAEAGESVNSFKAVLAQELGPDIAGGSSNGATSTGLLEPGHRAAHGEWPNLGALSAEARGAAAAALWGYSAALLARSCQVEAQGGQSWASSLLQDAEIAAAAVARVCPNSTLALRLKGHVKRCQQSSRYPASAVSPSPGTSPGLWEPPHPRAASGAGYATVAYGRYLHLNPLSVDAWADTAASCMNTTKGPLLQDGNPPSGLEPGGGRGPQGVLATRLALGAVASALAAARGEVQAHEDSEGAGPGGELALQPLGEAGPGPIGSGGYSAGHRVDSAPRIQLAHAWSTVAETCLARSTLAGGEDQATQPKLGSPDQAAPGRGTWQPSDDGSGVLPFLVLHTCAAAVAARPQNSRPWLVMAQLCLLPQTRAALREPGPPGGLEVERGRKAQLVAAAEEAVAKARVADPALAAPWALAALVKLASWEQGLAGKGALRGAWEDALLAVKSHAPGTATRILLGVLAAHLHRLDSAEAHVALSQLISLPDSPSQLSQLPPTPIHESSPETASAAASALFLLGASFLRRAGLPEAVACLEQALILLQSIPRQRRQQTAMQALVLSTLQLLGVAKVMQVLNASPDVEEPGDWGAADFQGAAALQEESSWDAAPLLSHALALLITCTRDQLQGGSTGDQRAQQLQKALKICQAAQARILAQAHSLQQLPGNQEHSQTSDLGILRVSWAQAAALRLQGALLCALQGPANALQHMLSVWAPRWTPAGMPGPGPAPPEVALAALAAAVLSRARMCSAGTWQGEAWSQCERGFTAALALCQASLGAPRHPSFPRAAHPWEQQAGEHILRMHCLEALFKGLPGSLQREGGPPAQGRTASSPVAAKLIRALHMFPDSLGIRYRLADWLAQSGWGTSVAGHLLWLPGPQSSSLGGQPCLALAHGPLQSMHSTAGAEGAVRPPAASLTLARSLAHAAVNGSLACRCCAAGTPHGALEGGATASKAHISTLRLLQRLVHTHPADAPLRALLLVHACSAAQGAPATPEHSAGMLPARFESPEGQGDPDGEPEARTGARTAPLHREDRAAAVAWCASGVPPGCARAAALLRFAASLASLLAPPLEPSGKSLVTGSTTPAAADGARAPEIRMPGAPSSLQSVLAPLWGLRQLGCCCTSGYPPKPPGGTAAQSFLPGLHSAACSARAALAATCLLAASECLLGIARGQDQDSDASSSCAADLALAAVHLVKQFPMSPGSGPGLQPCAALQQWRCLSWALHGQSDRGPLAPGSVLDQRLLSAAQETAGAVQAALGGGAGPAAAARAGAAAAAAGAQSIGLQWHAAHSQTLQPLAGRLLELVESACMAANDLPSAAALRVSQASLGLRSSGGPGAATLPLLALEDALEQLRSGAPQGTGILGPALFMHSALSYMQFKNPESGNDKSLLLAARRSLIEALEAEGSTGSLQGAHLLLCRVESDLAGSARAVARRTAAQAEQELDSWQASGPAQKLAAGSPGAPVGVSGGASQDVAAKDAPAERKGGGIMLPPDTMLVVGTALLQASRADRQGGHGAQGQEGKAQPRQPRAGDQSHKQRSSGVAGAGGPNQQLAQGQRQSSEAGAAATAWSPKELSILTRRALHLWPAYAPLRDLLGQTLSLSGAA